MVVGHTTRLKGYFVLVVLPCFGCAFIDPGGGDWVADVDWEISEVLPKTDLLHGTGKMFGKVSIADTSFKIMETIRQIFGKYGFGKKRVFSLYEKRNPRPVRFGKRSMIAGGPWGKRSYESILKNTSTDGSGSLNNNNQSGFENNYFDLVCTKRESLRPLRHGKRSSRNKILNKTKPNFDVWNFIMPHWRFKTLKSLSQFGYK